MWRCEDADLKMWRCEDVELQIWRCEDVEQQMWRCEDVECRSADLKVWRCRSADVKVWRCRSADVKVWRCRSADVKVWRCRSADVRVWRCITTAAFLRRTLRRRSREKGHMRVSSSLLACSGGKFTGTDWAVLLWHIPCDLMRFDSNCSYKCLQSSYFKRWLKGLICGHMPCALEAGRCMRVHHGISCCIPGGINNLRFPPPWHHFSSIANR